jgi:DNA recombination protein RmuC
MNTLVLVLLFAALAVAVAAAYVFGKSRAAARPGEDQALSLLQQQLEGIRRQLADSLTAQTQTVHQQLESVSRQVMESQRTVGDRLDNAARVVGDVQKTLGSLGQASERIFEVGKDLAGLQDILRSPKLRGGLGEYFLGDLLGQILPAKHFELQYGFKGGAVVDAVVRLGERLVPVDAKFPLENFRRLVEAPNDEDRLAARKKFSADVKKHVDAIALKYILPDEGTYDFAFMYIPAENVYYECIIKDDSESGALSEYALKRRVIPVSPASFYAYLQAILLGLKGLQVEENARTLLENLSRLEGDFRRFSEDFEMMGKHLSNARGKYDDAARRLEHFHEKLTSTTGAEETTQPKPLSDVLQK